MTRFAELYQNYSELSTILMSADLYFYHDETNQMMRDIIETRNNFLIELLQKHPIENCNFHIDILAKLINDMLQSEVHKWRMYNKSYSLVEAVLDYISNVL